MGKKEKVTGEEVAEVVNVRRRQARSTETRQKILDAALLEFSVSGFEGATTRSIARRAQVLHGLLIYHFETKLGVWQAVMEKAFRDLHEKFERKLEELEGLEPEAKLRALNRHFIEAQAARPEVAWLVSHEVSGDSSRFSWLLDRIRGHDQQVSLDLIRRVQEAGRYVQGDPAHVHFLFVGAATRAFALTPEIERRIGISPFDPAFVEQHVLLCEKLFFRRPKPVPATTAQARSRPATARSRPVSASR